MKEQIIWNGCDGYIETSLLFSPDYKFDVNDDGSYVLYAKGGPFMSIEVEEIDESEIPVDEDGEMDFPDDVYLSETGHFYRELKEISNDK